MAKTATSTKSSAKTTTGTTTAGNKQRPAAGEAAPSGPVCRTLRAASARRRS